MNNQIETDNFLENKKTKSSASSPPNGCCSKWWHQRFPHQRAICRVVESTRFLVFIIILVVTDTLLIIGEIMLDFIKLQHECQKEFGHKAHHHDHKAHERIELTMKILHFTSITFLSFFVLELIVKIYAFGREFWNIHRKKMAYFDAIIVIVSLAIDLYFLRGEEAVLGHRALLIISFRLWRFARIISSVAECVRENEKEHKYRLNKQYLIALQRVNDLLVHKTDYIQQQLSDNNDEKFNSILEYYRDIDSRCQTSIEKLNKNQVLKSSLVVEQFNEQLSRDESNKVGTSSSKDQSASDV